MKYVLDTNIVVAALNGIEPIRLKLAALGAREIVLSAPVIAELYFGARASARVKENVARVDRLVERFVVLSFDEEAARRFAELKAGLRALGRAKSDFDLAIASIALANGATLITNDAALLDGSIAGLVVDDWLGTTSK